MTSCFHIAIAMKPIEGTFAENALKHGVAGLAIDACRIGEFTSNTPSGFDRLNKRQAELGYRPGEYQKGVPALPQTQGRFPANILHDASAEVLAGFPEQKSGTRNGKRKKHDEFGTFADRERDSGYFKEGDSGSAARFFHAVEEYAAEAEE